jgi:hypothetical protein
MASSRPLTDRLATGFADTAFAALYPGECVLDLSELVAAALIQRHLRPGDVELLRLLLGFAGLAPIELVERLAGASQPFQHDIASFVEPSPERFEVECHGVHHDPDPDPLPDFPPPLPDPVPPLRVSAPEPTPCDPAPPVPMPPEPMYRGADG